MPLPMLPIALAISGGIAVVSGIALRLHALAKQKAATAAASTSASTTSVASPQQVQAAAASAGMTVDQLNAALAGSGTTPAVFVGSAIAAGGNVADQVLAAAQNPAAAVAALQTPASAHGVVTTNDPPPAGDLAIRSSPSNSAGIIGAADKDGTVIILNPDAAGDGLFAEIQWDGGNNPAVRGFAHKAFLTLQP